MPGLDKTRFVDVTDQDLDEYCCGICYEVFNNPLFSQCCRQTYCSDCINQWLTQHNTCPNDRKRLTVNQLSSPPRFAINLLNKLKIKCDFHTNGCKMIVALDQLSNHSDKCAFNPRNRSKVCEFCALVIQSDHNCVLNLKVKNDSISDEMKRLTNETKELKAEIKRLETNSIAEIGTKNEEIRRLANEITVLKEENQRLQTTVSSRPTFDRNDRTLSIIKNEMEKKVKDYALNIGYQAYNLYKHEVQSNGKIATFVVNKFQNKFNTKWNCMVSTDIYFDYFLYLGQNWIHFKIGQFKFVIWENE